MALFICCGVIYLLKTHFLKEEGAIKRYQLVKNTEASIPFLKANVKALFIGMNSFSNTSMGSGKSR
jgi:hypothetical protein